MRQIAGEITANQEEPPRGATRNEQLRSALTDHITGIDPHTLDTIDKTEPLR